jgi:DNA excision repair protein ERCC-4
VPARIVVDEREKKSGIPVLLRQAGAMIDFAQLKVGDYIVSPETAIERKTIQDLLNSIYDGRLFVQCSQLTEHYVKPVLIIEGNIVDLMDIPEEDDEDSRDIRKNEREDMDEEIDTGQEDEGEIDQGKDVNKLQGDMTTQRKRSKPVSEKIPLIYDALVKVAFDFRIPIIHTPSADYTAQLLVVMVNKSLQNGPATGPLLKRIKKGNPGHIQQLSILSSLPGVGDKLAVRMLGKFQTPRRALNASAAELSRISGFGTERAARVRRILDMTIDPDSNTDNYSVANAAKEGRTRDRGFELIQRTLLDDLTGNE